MTAPVSRRQIVTAPPCVFDHPEFDAHEQVVFGHDEATGLSTIIAVHSTALGPALGGCRMWAYPNPGEALTDALRLSRGMTYKNALAGLDLGGGKAVILADPRRDKTQALLAAFGGQVDRLAGSYITAEDVGISDADMEVVATRTAHVRGIRATGLGDPSPYTALGVFRGIQAALAHRFGSDDPAGRTVTVQGLGHVGMDVARRLHEAGARLTVADIHQPAVERAVAAFGAKSVAADRAHAAEADVFVPCALGAGLNDETIPELGAPIVAGAANNQLAEERHDAALRKRGVLYAPDYAINAGGVISVALGEPGVGDAAIRAKVEAIGDTLARIFRIADESDQPTQAVADRLAMERLAAL
ncbi:MAG: amino acid dehydrogenase [Stappia sp.]|uniref:Leu/Phe/Val dehydrogenase n=1 Tax=Stappia sp. TaxID=1870903 RepID=UPI000C696311|nr:Glu/Leu/Phe/Val dehydrogenase dimerization domain-containing protein [Stappia sp.]MAA98896.1 amino acid dehydrogenase [Stappia sp.]MBM21559.1 amino acid dehydrogenase [Stappia sp.]